MLKRHKTSLKHAKKVDLLIIITIKQTNNNTIIIESMPQKAIY